MGRLVGHFAFEWVLDASSSRRRRLAQRSCQPGKLIYMAGCPRSFRVCCRSGCVAAERRRARRDGLNATGGWSQIALHPTPGQASLAEDVAASEPKLQTNRVHLVQCDLRGQLLAERCRRSIPRAAVTSRLGRSEESAITLTARIRVNAKIDLDQNGALRLQEGRRPRHLRKCSSSDAQGRWTALRHQDHRSKIPVEGKLNSPTRGSTAKT